MRKAKPDSFVRAVAVRDIAALKRRVQALEKAMWPSANSTSRAKPAKQHRIGVDESTARRAVIQAFHKEEWDRWWRTNPLILEARCADPPSLAANHELRRASRARLNEYLRQRGFAPEPDVDD